ncbi:MAG: UDP-N-acetylmuramoyl-tripeptide--D-alanyl-D-alanine ligase [Candidatus Goldbacteria bacterium]|nr:UDP-N-acetylmuramoyl-tripeptide--D-alanyl-D-alanine ligase [Candidatus Goldiibacteriota bacterium]
MNLTLKEIYKVFNKNFDFSKDERVKGISIDTRTLKKGDVFFAIKGENTDGHNFIGDAFKKGAILTIAEKYEDKKIINVKDTKEALLKLAAYYLDKMEKVKVIAITGSNGKTTVKEILNKIFTEKTDKKIIAKSPKSFNNIIGIPLTIFELNKDHKILILEIGMNKAGEIKKITEFIKTDVAVITNVGLSHIGLLKSKKNIARAKSEIFYGLKKFGIAVLNRDDEYYEFLSKRAGKIVKDVRLCSFGTSEEADLRISGIRNNNGRVSFNMETKKENVDVYTQLPGIHNAYNVAAAAAASSFFGIKLSDVKNAMKDFRLKNMMRLEERHHGGITVIRDCYNANPDSFKAALQFLKEKKFNNVIAVIGDMYELGTWTRKFHNDVGGLFADVELKKLIATGKYSDYYLEGFVKSGGDRNVVRIFNFNQKKQMSDYLSGIIKKGDTLFLKGSRKNKLEEILDNLKFIYKRR